MTAISSTTTSSSVSRISGLASGLDTDSLVENLTSTTRSKIEKVEQQKQILEWKKEDYRTILSNLVDFNETYFGTSSSSISIGDALNKLTATSSNTAYVQAIAGSRSQSGSVYISDIVSLATAAKVQSSAGVSPDLSFTVDTENLSSLAGTSMNVTLDGTTKTITFAGGTYTSSEDVASALSFLLDTAFGSGRISVSGDNGKLTLSADNSALSISNPSTDGTGALDILGFDEDTDVSSNRLTLSNTLASYSSLFGEDENFSFTINGESFTFDNTTTISQIITAVNASDAKVKLSYSSVTDTFTLASTETGSGSSVTFSDSSGGFMSAIMGGAGTATAGTDAIVKLSLDGSTEAADQITITRSSNTFTLEGTTYTLKGKASGTTQEGVSVHIEQDIDTIVEKITGFVDAYNKLLGSITDKLYEERDSDFQPLTDSEKEDLSDDEIEDWTEKARAGWLRNDSHLSTIATALRSSLYTDVTSLDGSGDDIGIILADIGITTSDYTNEGKLTIDEDKLRTALANDTEGVVNLFTQSSSVSYSLYNSSEDKATRYKESGLLWRINDIIKANVSTVGKKGSLVTLVGNPNIGYTGTSTYSERIDEMEDKIEALKDKLADQEDYYYSKFTAMETAINSLNAQSSYFTSMLSS